MATDPKGKGSSSDQSKLLIHAPHFFKIVLLASDQGLKIPDAFMKKHGGSLQDIVLLRVPNGASWKVELAHHGTRTWLQKGWQEFAEHYSIKYFHFLVFRYDGNSQFHVIIFDPTAVEVEYPSEANCDRSGSLNGSFRDEFLINPLAGQRNSSHVRTEVNVAGYDDEVEEIFVETLKTYTTTQASEGKRAILEDIDGDLSIGILDDLSEFTPKMRPRPCTSSHKLIQQKAYPITQASKGKRARVEDNEEDVSIEILDNLLEFKPKLRPRPRTRSQKLATENQSIKSNGNKKVKRNLVENSEESFVGTKMPFPSPSDCKRGIGKEKSESYQNAKTFRSSKPFFISFMCPLHVSNQFQLEIPSNFVKDYLPMKENCKFTLHVSGQIGKWPVIFRVCQGRGRFRRTGWRTFVQDNSIKTGDSCVFELVPGAKKFNISIYRSATI